MMKTLTLALGVSLAALAAPAAAEVSFTREVAPVVLKRCAGCHGERVNLGGWRAHTFQALMKPGASGAASVVPGQPEKSKLLHLLVEKSPERRMPKSDDPLSPAQIDLFRRWVREGAKFDGPDPSALLKSLLGPRQHPAAPVSYRTPVPVLALALAPGGGEVAVGGYHEVTLWNAATGALVRRIGRLPQRIQALSFTADGKRLLVGGGTPGEYGEVALVDVATGARSKVVDTFPDIVLAATFSPDGRLVSAAGADASVRVYDLASGKRQWTSKVHSDWVTSLSFSADGRFLASASKDMTVKVYEVRDGSLFTTYNGHNRQIGKYQGQHPVYAVRFAPDSPAAYSAGGGKWVQVWEPAKAREEGGDAGDMEERFAKQGHARYIEHGFKQELFALATRGGRLFAGAADGAVKQFDPATLQEVRAYGGASDWVFALDFDPASQRLAAGSYGGEVRVWDTRTGQPLAVFQAQPGAPARQAARQ